MGKGDPRTKRGKITKGTYGKSRLAKKEKPVTTSLKVTSEISSEELPVDVSINKQEQVEVKTKKPATKKVNKPADKSKHSTTTKSKPVNKEIKDKK